jgi:F-type H+-transporting ATPase subunit gamma
MANQKEIRVKIASTKKTMKITSAMKLVAAAKVNKMQKILVQARPYAAKIKEIFINLESSLSEDQKNSIPLLASRNKEETILLIVISSDRGLCGAYNTNIIKTTAKRIDELQAQAKKVKLITVGRKAKTAFNRDSYANRGIEVLESFLNLSSLPNSSEASLIAEKAMEAYLTNETDKVEIISTKFISLVASSVQISKYLPIEKPKLDLDSKFTVDPDILLEPSATAIVDTLLPMYTQSLIYQALLESTTSELAARMTAMSNATKNAKEFINKLVLAYNKARQAGITQEISEIVGGAAALE